MGPPSNLQTQAVINIFSRLFVWPTNFIMTRTLFILSLWDCYFRTDRWDAARPLAYLTDDVLMSNCCLTDASLITSTIFAGYNSLGPRLYFRSTSAPSSVCIYTSGNMAMFYTTCLQDLPKLTISDVHRLVRKVLTPRSKREKGHKMYLSSFIDNYEGKFEIDSKTHSH